MKNTTDTMQRALAKKHLCGLLEKFTNGNLQNAPAAHLKILLPLALVLL